MFDGEEKRVNPRIRPFNLDVDLIIDNTRIIKKTRVQDVSLGGVNLVPNTVVGVGDTVQVKFTFLYDTMIINASVVRINIRDLALKFLFKNTREQEKYKELFEKELYSANKGILEEMKEDEDAEQKTKPDDKKMFDLDLD